MSVAVKRDEKFPVVEVENNPVSEGSWVFRRFGDHVVGKGELENGAMYALFRKSIWEPSGNKFNDRLDRSYRLVLADGSMFDPVGVDFWPKAIAVMKNDPHEVEKTWRKVEQERIRAVIGQVFPEVLEEGAVVSRGGVVFIFTPGTFLDTGDLDTIIDYAGEAGLGPFLGTAIEHDMHGRTGTLVQAKDGSKFLVKWVRECMRGDWDEETNEDLPCPNDQKVTFYTMSGCHHGAWCYIADPETGKYQADLRNVTVICDECSG